MVGPVTFLLYHHFIPYMVVCKVNSEVGPVCCSYLTPHHWAPELCQHCWEGYPTILDIPRGGGGSPDPPFSYCFVFGGVPLATLRLAPNRTPCIGLDTLGEHVKIIKGGYLTATEGDTVSLYKYTFIFDASLFDRVVTSSIHLIFSQTFPYKYVHTFFLKR